MVFSGFKIVDKPTTFPHIQMSHTWPHTLSASGFSVLQMWQHLRGIKDNNVMLFSNAPVMWHVGWQQ